MVGLFSHIFLTGFIYNTPLELATRIFDLFILDKEDALIYCLCKIIGLMKDKIIEIDSIVFF